MKRFKETIFFISRIIVFFVFGLHAIDAFFLDETMVEYFGFVGFSSSISIYLLILVAIHDAVIALLALLKPSRLLAIWTFVWPILPTVVDYLVHPSHLDHLVSHIIAHSSAGLIFYVVGYTQLIEFLSKKLRRIILRNN